MLGRCSPECSCRPHHRQFDAMTSDPEIPTTLHASVLTRRRLLGIAASSPLALGAGAVAEAAPWVDTPPRAVEEAAFDFVAEFDPMWRRTRVYTMEVARAMPEALWGYRPVDDVRTFAEQIMHIAGTQYGFSDAIRGESLPNAPSFDVEGKAPDEMLDILDGAFDVVINLLIALKPEQLEERIRWARRIGGESTHSKRGVALTIWHHTAHHRAQLVVYLRMNGIAPPGYMD